MSADAPLILVVDDQPGVRLLVQEVFTEIGYRVLTAAHGREAMALIAEECPSVALVDIRMPVMDGMETLRFIRSAHPTVPVVIMTAIGDADKAVEAMAAGAFVTVSKPFDVFYLRDMVRQVLSQA